ncbi:UDP-N-acetylmuramoyl-L-alanine--D-glutamate ligase [Patescibacteria group bacterium]
MNYKGKKIAVLGFGVEGESAVDFLLKSDAIVTVFDEKKRKKDLVIDFSKLEKMGVKFIYGKFNKFDGYDYLIVSPGIRLDRPEIKQAKKYGAIITTATNIFMGPVPCATIGVTGTKGKGTTSAMITEILKASRIDAYLGGNIGIPALDFLDKLNAKSMVVLELSSFQIASMEKSPNIAVILMTTSEHLDFHKDTDEYVESKANLIKNQKKGDSVIYNIDYKNTRKIGESVDPRLVNKYEVSLKGKVQVGAYVKDKYIYFSSGTRLEKIIKCSDIFIPGKHNWENVCAAVVVAKIFNIPNKNIVKAVKMFKGLPHRIEYVREVGGVNYYDDSFSTVPETAIAAINAFDQPKVMILGGSSKNSDFNKLGEVISQSKSIRGIVGIGKEWDEIKKFITDSSRQEVVEGCKDMKEMVEAARKLAKSGDVVVLSPACASFDMFINYKDRGDQFKEQVKLLK